MRGYKWARSSGAMSKLNYIKHKGIHGHTYCLNKDSSLTFKYAEDYHKEHNNKFTENI